MADYYPVISRAVAALEINNSETRRAFYDCARAAQLEQLRQRPFIKKDFDRERLMLEDAISRVEIEAATKQTVIDTLGTPEPLASGQVAPIPPVYAHKNKSFSVKHPFELRSLALSALVLSLLIGGVVLLLFAMPMLVRGMVWFSDRAIDYMYWPVNIAFAACILIFAPLSLFRRTRAFSAGGFLVSSLVFGACTWLAGVLATYDYLGAFWVFIGLAVIGVGIVSIGIVGAMIHSDWLAAGLLFGSLVMTFGTRLIGAAIGAWSEKH